MVLAKKERPNAKKEKTSDNATKNKKTKNKTYTFQTNPHNKKNFKQRKKQKTYKFQATPFLDFLKASDNAKNREVRKFLPFRTGCKN